MNWVKIKTVLTKPLIERKMNSQVKQSYCYRDLLEAVRKREEFRLKMFELQKRGNKDYEKYYNYIEALDWVIQTK